jgi:hypothetical protein
VVRGSTILKGRLLSLQLAVLLFTLTLCSPSSLAARQHSPHQRAAGKRALVLENGRVRCSVRVEGEQLVSDRLEIVPAWASQNGGSTAAIETDADFGLDLMFSDWDAPGKANNADNLIVLTKKHFSFAGDETRALADGTQELVLSFKGVGHSIRLRVTYRLEPNAFYVKRNISVQDSSRRDHFLRWFLPRYGEVSGVVSVVKDGGFGQPVAVLVRGGGAFFGLEYPACDDHLDRSEKGAFRLRCGEEYGERIRTEWLTSDWVVEGVTPDPYVKLWFFKYLDKVRVAPLRPYSLYNTWYDLRSPEYPHWSPDNVMSEATAMKMVDLLRRNMIEKNNIKLDAFVLDDGWDVYQSDWVLRREQWPHGLKPLADELKRTHTNLGMWFGPTGGYSFHNLRIGWMKEHGYEVVDNMMCVAGKNYSVLLKKRVTDFVENDGVGYYKWDGIQFSCSEPDHGHPIGVYSRRAVLQSVAAMCTAVREKNPDIFLNITSGTWMSPWWVKYANTIWMQGADYGFADVPSISSRDASITYRDFVLYEDWKLKGLWFPIANLMTHGIIKGKNESVGTTVEPLDKFTDDVLLYVARGVSMYELYISPDILSDGEWTSISRSLAWARDRFPILMNTELVGGNPMKGEAYGYTHFKGNRGIIAARNPVMEASRLKVDLTPSQGLDPKASSMVLERVYPTRWISPRLCKAGETVTLPLDGYEMAVYELYPLAGATEPLLAGATFNVVSKDDDAYRLRIHDASPGLTILNPSVLKSREAALREVKAVLSQLRKDPTPRVVTGASVKTTAGDNSGFSVNLSVSPTSVDGMLAVLLVPDMSVNERVPLKMAAQLDGREASVQTERQEGKSQWFKIEVAPGKHELTMQVSSAKAGAVWKGRASVWFVSRQKQSSREIDLALRHTPSERLLPPTVWPAGEVRKNVKIGEVPLSLKVAK